MHNESIFISALIFLAAAVVAVPLARRAGFGSVLGYLVAGIIIGPFALGLVGDEGQEIMYFAEFGVVMMLFLIGLELNPKLLWHMRVSIVGMGGLQVGLTAALLTIVGLLFELKWQVALAIGFVLALSSTALVLQTMYEKNLSKNATGKNAFSVLLFQDIAVIPMLALLPLLATYQIEGTGNEHSSSLIAHLNIWLQTIIIFAALAFVIVTGLYAIRPVLRFVAATRTRELFTAMALMLVIGVSILMAKVGLSPALGAFVAGVILAGSEYRHELERNIEPFKGLLLGLFFIAVGAAIDFEVVMKQPLLIPLLVAILVTVKLAALLIVARIFKIHKNSRLLFSVLLAQGGEFGFVLFSFSLTHGILQAEIVSLLTVVIAISMALTPILLVTYERLLSHRFTEKAERENDEIDEKNPVILIGFGRFGTVVGRFLRATGIDVTILDSDPDFIEVLRKMGIKTFYGDVTDIDILHSAGADDAKLILLAMDEPELNIKMADEIRHHFPNAKVMVRARARNDAYQLIDMGFEYIYRETFETALRMGRDVLYELGYRAYQARRLADLFRRHDIETLYEMAEIRHDETQLINNVQIKTRELEGILNSETMTDTPERDKGWDASSLREKF